MFEKIASYNLQNSGVTLDTLKAIEPHSLTWS